MKPVIKLGIGALLTGIGLVITFAAERQLIAERDCVDCEEEVKDNPVHDLDEDIPSFIEQAEKEREESEND